MRVGFIGNTVLTLKALESVLEYGYDIRYVFGLSPTSLAQKANACDMVPICHQHNIEYINNEDWAQLLKYEVDLIIEFGDSRLVPKEILACATVLGNHGAILPYVQGGASLVYGRMLNTGRWGVSLMELDKTLDSGKIVGTQTIRYNPAITMEDFVTLCDDATVVCLKKYLAGEYEPIDNRTWDIRVKKGTDSQTAITTLRFALKNNYVIYMPSRCPQDGVINRGWGSDFKRWFKQAMAFPYPTWTEE
jgi:methionyl-tRNA formyltransferase